MVIGHFDGINKPRNAQGPKSREFHFSAKLCRECNSVSTQPPDKEFVHFHQIASELHLEGRDPGGVFNLERYNADSEPYLNVFRYFAKLLACHIAESEGPRSLHIASFANRKSNFNPIKLFIDTDPFYHEYAALSGDRGFAAHGGLVVKANQKTKLPSGFQSSLSLGSIRYNFWVEFSPLVAVALKLFHREFFRKCEAAYQEALRRHELESEN